MTKAIEALGQLAKLLNVEQEEDLRQYESVLRNTPISRRKHEGLTWHPVRVSQTGFGLGAYPFVVVERNPGDQLPHHFSAGTPVAVFGEGEDEILQGTAVYARGREMKISFLRDELPDWMDSDGLGVNVLFDTHTYKSMMRALNEAINATKGRLAELREVLFGGRGPAFSQVHPFAVERLNPSQNAAMMRVLEAEDVAVIHGPPGTGKTTTLVECVRQLVKREKQVMICAPSNTAVDNLAEKLHRADLRVLRIGNLAKVSEALQACSLEVQMQRDPDYKQIGELKKRAAQFRKLADTYKRSFGQAEREQRRLQQREAKELVKQARETEDYLSSKLVDQAQVIACTLVGSAHPLLGDRRFSTVVIDESGQALEPGCWIPLLRSDKLVLAGDPLQLPPTVKSRDAARNGLEVTLLERLVRDGEHHVLLDTQYRMHADIMAFSNRKFYGEALQAHSTVAAHTIGDGGTPVEFIDTAGCGYEEAVGEASQSRSNPEEMYLLDRHLQALQPEASFSIGIISPYRAQVEAIREHFAERPEITVQTVDGFQGQERDIIYISLVRSNATGQIGFLKDYRRMNVAMTRARRKLVIIGDSATIGQDGFYADFLEHAEASGAYRSAWEFMDV